MSCVCGHARCIFSKNVLHGIYSAFIGGWYILCQRVGGAGEVGTYRSIILIPCAIVAAPSRPRRARVCVRTCVSSGRMRSQQRRIHLPFMAEISLLMTRGHRPARRGCHALFNYPPSPRPRAPSRERMCLGGLRFQRQRIYLPFMGLNSRRMTSAHCVVTPPVLN